MQAPLLDQEPQGTVFSSQNDRPSTKLTRKVEEEIARRKAMNKEGVTV